MGTRRLRTLLLGLAATLLLAALALSAWLRQHPEAAIAALNARLPAGIALGELHGLRLSALGGRLATLSLAAGNNELRVAGANWYWRVTGLWPLTVEPQWIEIERLQLRLAPDTEAVTPAAPLLPRFWQARWWPLVAHLSVNAEQLEVLDAAGALLLAARIEAAQGGASGAASVRMGELPPLTLQWRPDASQPRAWIIDWRGDAPEPPSGTLRLQHAQTGPAWQLEARLPRLDAGGLVFNTLALSAQGSSDLFDARAALAAADFTLDGRVATPAGEAGWRCAATLALEQSRQSTLRIAHCTASLGAGQLEANTPLSLKLDAALAPLELRGEGGSLRVRDLALGDWSLDRAEATLPPGPLRDAASGALSLPPAALSASLRHAGSGARGAFTGHLARTHAGTDGNWSAALAGTLALQREPHVLKPLTLDAKLSGDAERARLAATLALPGMGRLLAGSGEYRFGAARYRGQFALDSRDWNWGEGLLASLLGARQTLAPGELRGGQLRATLSLDGVADRWRMKLDGAVHGLIGVAAGYGFAGVDCTPLALESSDGAINRFADLHCSAQSVNAGIVLERLRGTLRHDAGVWTLRDIGGDVLGGSFYSQVLGPLGAPAIEAGLTLRDIDLARVGALLGDPDLTLNGVLAGTLPLRIEGTKVTVRDGEAHSTAPGLIRYRAATPPADQSPELALTRKALTNLEFDTLAATLQYDAADTLTLAAQIRGRNPDLDEKRPVHLNLTLETNLRTLLRSLTASERINEWVEKHL